MKMRKLLLPSLFGIALFIFPLYADETAYYVHADKILHLIGGAIAAWFLAGVFADTIAVSGKLKCAVILLMGVCAIGLAWEVLEFFAPDFRQTFFLFRFMQGGDWADTAGDIAADIAGGLLFSIPFVLIKKRN